VTPSPLSVQDHDPLREPILLLAYAGWSDGGDAATTAVRYLLEQLRVTRIAQIDTEEFLDFTVVRPHVRLREDRRTILWPNHEFFAIEGRFDPPDVVFGLGVEPHLRWRRYVEIALQLVRELCIQRVYLFGAYLDEVIYSQPTQIGVSSADPALARALGLSIPAYEGPTGMLGVLAVALAEAGIEALSLWARIPHYVSTRPNYRGALALLHQLEALSGLRFDLSSLSSEAAEFDQEVAELIASDPQLSAYVRELKRRAFSS
jgi:predicted ATP-grasp superfamily ATP-dependent carboligase